MIQISSHQAAIKCVDRERGDQFVAILEGDSAVAVVVQTEQAIPGDDAVYKHFVAGAVGFNDMGRAVFIRLREGTFIDCRQLDPLARCPECFNYSMQASEGYDMTCENEECPTDG